jgi:formyltetrahydrofolate synthetase
VAVKRACAAHREEDFKFLYPLELSIQDKIEKIAKDIYGAAEVTYSEEALAKIELFTKCGYGALPICMAKTHLSLSADATAKNVPTGFTIPIRDIRCSAGAGFIYPLVRLGESGRHLDKCFCIETWHSLY